MASEATRVLSSVLIGRLEDPMLSGLPAIGTAVSLQTVTGRTAAQHAISADMVGDLVVKVVA